MTREDITRMARETCVQAPREDWNSTAWVFGEETLERFAALVAAAEREKVAAWMIQFGFATGHGDTLEQLVDALGSEIVDRIEVEIDCEREACAKVCESEWSNVAERMYGDECAAAIRARGETK